MLDDDNSAHAPNLQIDSTGRNVLTPTVEYGLSANAVSIALRPMIDVLRLPHYCLRYASPRMGKSEISKRRVRISTQPEKRVSPVDVPKRVMDASPVWRVDSL